MGNLTVRDSILTALALPNLLVVRGLVIEANTALTSVRLPALKASDDVLLVGNAVLETLEIPALKEVGGEFAMRENDKLDTVRITSLTKVAGNFDCLCLTWQIMLAENSFPYPEGLPRLRARPPAPARTPPPKDEN